MNDQTSIVAFFSAEGVFRKKTAESQRKAFDALAEDFATEFDRPLGESDWQLLCAHKNELAEAKRKREAAKLQREQDKAARLEAMPVSAGVDSADGHVEQFGAGAYVLTAAQNNTDVDAAFLGALERFAAMKGARILCGRMTYNKGAFRQPDVNDSEGIYYAEEIQPYLVQGHIDLGGAQFIADANVIPTSKWPTSGFDGVTPSGIDAIIPASKIELRVSAALKGAETKVIAATGAVTKRNYILRKTGAVASFGHSIGAIYVNTLTGEMRHLERVGDDLGFYDVDGYYAADNFTPLASGDVAALQFGDIHAEKMEDCNLNRALSMIEEFDPENVVLHDVLDFSSRNHHNIKDPVFLHKQMVKGNTVRGDLEALATVLDAIADRTNGEVHIIESNHDLAINTWLKNADFKLDPINGTVYLKCMLAQYEHNETSRGYFNMLQFAYKKIGGGDNAGSINFHETDESLVIAGIEMGNHGHNGANGSRGSRKQFASLGDPMNTGHTHSPCIYGPCYTAGVTASLEMGYNIGPSSWAIADVITYANGQRQILFA